jgi:ABC-type nickel/cobalt efflux system permease component RcnA
MRLETLLNTPGLLALGTAFFLGAAHALTPGHGKTIVAAYLAGSRGRLVDAVYLGAVVTATHTASVFVLGLLALYATQTIAVERIYPWLSFVSGALILAVGLWLLKKRWHERDGHHHHHHHPGHDHHHRGHDHDHHDNGHSHDQDRKGVLALGISGGLAPCPEALVVLMLSISLGRAAFGLALLAAFTLGLAAVLIAIGAAVVLAGSRLGKAPRFAVLPLVSAGVVTLAGAVLVAQSSAVLRFW